jgi:radical SAM superfamily enzyme YgiQ (UPF0313 family)
VGAPLDLLLINPASRPQVYQSLGAELAAIEPPVWAGLMASFVRGRGYSVQILDANAEGLGAEVVADRVAELKPTLAAVVVYGHQPSASTQVMPSCGAVTRAIAERAPGVKTLLVGGHVAALPERTMREETVDFVCSGEGLHTLVGLIEAARAGTGYDKVPDLVYREAGQLCSTPPAALVSALDAEMPGPAWDLLPMSSYRAHNWHCFGTNLERQPYAAIYTTLGCPYKCSFCCIQAPFKPGESVAGLSTTTNSYRFWSPAAVLDTIETLVTRYGVRNIKIADEMFVLHPRHVLGIANGIIERGYDLNIWAYARVDTVKDSMVDTLRRAGFTWLAFGVESASDRVRVDVQKGFGQELVYRTLEKVRAAGINVIGNYIFGLPEDDRATMQETLDLAIDLNCEFANFYCAMAYPGSDLYRRALAEHWALPERWSGYSQHSYDSLPLPTRHLSAADVLRFRDAAFQTYFTNPRYLALAEQRFGSATVAHLADMVRQPLRRRLLEA